MPDSLLFDGTDDKIVLDDGSASHTGAWSLFVVAKFGDDSGFENLVGVNTPSSDSIFGTNNGAPRLLVVFPGSGSAMTSTFSVPSSDGWCIYGVTRADDAAGTLHKYVYSTATWTHEVNANSINDITDITDIVLGAAGNIAQFFNGNMLAAAWWNSELTTTQVDSLARGKQAWRATNPTEAWRLDNLGALASFASGGTASETSRTGTSLDAGDAPNGWVDSVPNDYAQFPKSVLRPATPVRY